MLIENLLFAPSYNVERLSKAQKGLARKSDNFYSTNGRLEILLRLMKSDPSSEKISDLINDLPWAAKTYVLTKVVQIMPDGTSNPSYKG